MSTRKGRIIFAGSPEFAVPTLQAIAHAGHEVVAVLTQPDRPAGRGQRSRASAVKVSALALGFPVLQPASLKRDPEILPTLARLQPDLMVVVAYGLILPRAVLDLSRCGCVNVHASLLPRWRGAAPIPAAILAGDLQTGVTLMQLDEGLDTGPMLASRTITIGAEETAAQLHDRLAALGAELLPEHLPALLAGSVHAIPQPADGVTYAPKLAKADALLNWNESALLLHRRIRAYNPWPVAETRLDGMQLRCWAAALPGTASNSGQPGAVIGVSPSGIDVQTGEGSAAACGPCNWPAVSASARRTSRVVAHSPAKCWADERPVAGL